MEMLGLMLTGVKIKKKNAWAILKHTYLNPFFLKTIWASRQRELGKGKQASAVSGRGGGHGVRAWYPSAQEV